MEDHFVSQVRNDHPGYKKKGLEESKAGDGKTT